VPVLLIGSCALLLGRLFPLPETRASGVRKWRIVSAVVLLVFWAPPLVEQLTRSEGNLTRIFRFVVEPPEPIVGLKNCLLMTGSQLLPWGAWLGHDTASWLNHLRPGAPWEVVASALPVLITVALAVRFRDRHGLRLAAIAAAGLVACIAATSQIRGVAAAYL